MRKWEIFGPAYRQCERTRGSHRDGINKHTQVLFVFFLFFFREDHPKAFTQYLLGWLTCTGLAPLLAECRNSRAALVSGHWCAIIGHHVEYEHHVIGSVP